MSDANLFDSSLHTGDYSFAPIAGSNCSRDDADICIDVRQILRSEANERCSGLENFDDRFLLIRHGCNYKVWTSSDNLFGIGRPGVGKNRSRLRFDFRNHIGAIFCTGDYAIQFANLRENYGSAGLQTSDPAWGMGRHESQLGFEATQRNGKRFQHQMGSVGGSLRQAADGRNNIRALHPTGLVQRLTRN